MPATLDLSAVRRFTDDLKEQVQRCDNGEGDFCIGLEGKIDFYVDRCTELLRYINEWTEKIRTGQTAFDEESERLLKAEAAHLLGRAEDVAAKGRENNEDCNGLQGLNTLCGRIADLKQTSERLEKTPVPGLHLGAFQTTDDFDEPLPDEFWLGTS